MNIAAAFKFFTSPYGLVLLAVLGGLIAAGVIYTKGEHKGEATVKAADQKATIKTQKRIDDAESRAPRTPADVSKRLRDGSF